jgi:hypothetical protein
MPRRVCYVNELKKRTHQRVIDLLRHVVVADRESESGTFGSDPPIMVGGSLNLAERVAFRSLSASSSPNRQLQNLGCLLLLFVIQNDICRHGFAPVSGLIWPDWETEK